MFLTIICRFNSEYYCIWVVPLNSEALKFWGSFDGIGEAIELFDFCDTTLYLLSIDDLWAGCVTKIVEDLIGLCFNS